MGIRLTLSEFLWHLSHKYRIKTLYRPELGINRLYFLASYIESNRPEFFFRVLWPETDWLNFINLDLNRAKCNSWIGFWYCFCKGQRVSVLFLKGSEGVRRSQNSLHFNFSQIRSEGGDHQISIFSQIQNSLHCARGGSRKLWTFPKFCDIFNYDGSP